MDFLVNLVPNNVIKAMGDGDMLALMVFAVFLGVGLAMVRTEPARRFEEALQGLYDVVMHLLGLVIQLAPFGVAALLFTLTARLGVDVLRQLGAYVAVVVGALAIHQFVVYSISVWWLGGMSPWRFFRGIRTAMLTAFSTASSNATLPTALVVAERELGLPPHVSRFVLTVGSTANQNGTALFEGVTVLFLAQFYGVHLSIAQQLSVVFICILGGIGTAGVPAGSIPVVIMILWTASSTCAAPPSTSPATSPRRWWCRAARPPGRRWPATRPRPRGAGPGPVPPAPSAGAVPLKSGRRGTDTRISPAPGAGPCVPRRDPSCAAHRHGTRASPSSRSRRSRRWVPRSGSPRRAPATATPRTRFRS